jgi:hypothetical protein
MKLTNEEKDEITWRVVDSLYEKLANEGIITNQEVIDFYNNEWWDEVHK